MRKSKLFSSTMAYFCAMVMLIIFYIVVDNVDLSFMSAQTKDIFTTVIIQIIIIFLLPLTIYTLFKKQSVKRTFKDFNYNAISFKTVIYSLLLGITCYFVNVLVASFFSNIIALFGYERIPSYSTGFTATTTKEFLINLVLVAVLPAICEETAHRGLLLGGLSRLGLKRSVLLSSLLFGLLHLNVNQFFYATVLGFLMAIAVIMAKSIIPAMIIHFCNNALSLYMSFASEKGLFGSKITSMLNSFLSGSNPVTAFLGSFAILTGLTLLVVVLYVLILKENRIKKMSGLLKDISSVEMSKQEREKIMAINPKANPFSNTYINNLETINSFFKEYNLTSEQELIFKKEESEYHKPKFLELVFLIGAIILGILVTIFTFVWGIL